MPSPKLPPPINPTTTAQTQQGFNLQGGQQTQALNTIGQDTPYGKLDYTTSIDPITGLPKYQAKTTLSPEQQNILNNLQTNQQNIGGAEKNLVNNSFGQYGSAPDLIGGANSLTMQALNSQLPAWERFDAPARAQQDTQLRNSGILPDKNNPQNSAYDQQRDKLIQQQDLNRGQWLANFEPQAFQQALTSYQTPLNTAEQLQSLAQPADVKGSLIGTPNANVGAADYSSAAISSQQQAFQNAQMQIARQNALMGMGVGAITGLAGMPVNPTGNNLTFGRQALNNIFANPTDGQAAGIDATGTRNA